MPGHTETNNPTEGSFIGHRHYRPNGTFTTWTTREEDKEIEKQYRKANTNESYSSFRDRTVK